MLPSILSFLKSASASLHIHNCLNNLICYETSRKMQNYFCTSSVRPSNGDKKGEKDIVLPPEPQDCCMSGCANCVWIKYAEEITKLIDDGGEVAKAKLLEHVKDPNLRSFLMIELEDLFKKKDEK